jgi:hypothetical protein
LGLWGRRGEIEPQEEKNQMEVLELKTQNSKVHECVW